MRTPSSPCDRWKWWEDALAGRSPPIHDSEPHAGFFKVRKFPYGHWPRGPFIPARIWWEPGETDPETGELLTDEICRAEVDGKRTNPWRAWIWIAKRPITMEEWEWLKALSPLLPKKVPGR
jgi:hypothetical protein